MLFGNVGGGRFLMLYILLYFYHPIAANRWYSIPIGRSLYLPLILFGRVNPNSNIQRVKWKLYMLFSNILSSFVLSFPARTKNKNSAWKKSVWIFFIFDDFSSEFLCCVFSPVTFFLGSTQLLPLPVTVWRQFFNTPLFTFPKTPFPSYSLKQL